MAAVVENDVAGVAAAVIAVDLPEQALRDLVGGGFLPILRHRIPRDRDQSELASKLQNIRPPRAKGRAEVADRFAGDFGEQIVGACELVEHVGLPHPREIRVAPGVVANQVSGVGDAAGEFRLSLGKFADQKESRTDIVLGEDVEEARRPCRIGSVVEGESELTGIARGYEGAAEDLRGGPMRRISKTADAKPGCAGDTDRPVNTRG